ncbi:deaminase domain-containing protein [Brevibacillus agri]|uniref:deaminase domain-containing protein n=1 Tax=Brevibacillus agri TaxID=51101 RepID=UPI003D70F992
MALDVVGLIPGVGEIADLANAGISLARGDYAGAALSLAACIPFAGWAATGAKLAGKATKALKATKTGSKVLKATEKASDVIKKVTDVSQAAIGKVVTTARKMEEKLGIIEAVKKMKDAMHKRIMAAKEAVMNKAREMKAKVKERARAVKEKVRELPERMQEGMNRLGEVLQPKAVTPEGVVMKASKSEDKVVNIGRTANQKKWDEVYHPGSANNAKVPEGTGSSRKLDETVDAEFISKVKEMKKNLPSKIRNKYNFGYAEVNIEGLNKKDYYAHSGINKIEDLEDPSARAKIQDISTEPLGKDKLFTTQKVNTFKPQNWI